MATTAYLKTNKVASEQDRQKIAAINTGVDEYDAAIAGRLNLSVAGSANVTLTRAQALNRLWKFTGVLTGNITIFIPASLGSVVDPLVWNATTGAFTITFKTTVGGSAGVTVTQTKKVYLMHDGTDVYKATTEV